jgi:hypothetical protein
MCECGSSKGALGEVEKDVKSHRNKNIFDNYVKKEMKKKKKRKNN